MVIRTRSPITRCAKRHKESSFTDKVFVVEIGDVVDDEPSATLLHHKAFLLQVLKVRIKTDECF